MGSWGFKTFEDDTTLDWLGDFGRSPSLRSITDAFNIALAGNYLDDLASAAALGAAEVVAAMNGKSVSQLTEDEPASRWVREQPAPTAELLDNAKNAVKNVVTDSEFREIWEDAGETSLNKWKAEIDDLLTRLS